jgi:hypothetical protein
MPEPSKKGGSTRFKPGHKGGPGNPFLGKVQSFRKAFFEALKTTDVAELVEHLLSAARVSDATGVAAAKLLLAYAIGQPTASVEVSGPDGAPLTFSGQALMEARARALARDLPALHIPGSEKEGDGR